jgi:hypothetical protein
MRRILKPDNSVKTVHPRAVLGLAQCAQDLLLAVSVSADVNGRTNRPVFGRSPQAGLFLFATKRYGRSKIASMIQEISGYGDNT